jgi:hypothetical protein
VGLFVELKGALLAVLFVCRDAGAINLEDDEPIPVFPVSFPAAALNIGEEAASSTASKSPVVPGVEAEEGEGEGDA